MKTTALTRNEVVLFLASLCLPLLVEACVAIWIVPEARWLMPASILFPAGLLAGITLRGGKATSDAPASRAPVREGLLAAD